MPKPLLIIDNAFYADPYPAYARLRRRPGPTFHQPEQTWLVSRYNQVEAVLKDPRFSKELPAADRSPLSATMLFQNPPAHRRLREPVAAAFGTYRIRRLAAHIKTVADRLIDSIENRRSMDFVSDFAMPLPVALIAEMLGVEESQAPLICEWSRSLVRAGTPGVTDPNVLQAGAEAVSSMSAFFSARIVAEKANPGDTLLAELLATEGDQKLDEAELLGTCMLLMIAGHETTVNLLGNGLYLLFKYPEQWQLLKQDPELMTSAVEEMLRCESPVQRSTYRCTLDAVEVGGTRIPAGSLVTALIAAANRDPDVFPDPDCFNIRRTPNPHLAFGSGVHYCLGATLAREEAAIAFSQLFARLPNLRLQAGQQALRIRPSWLRNLWYPDMSGVRALSWSSSTIVRGLQSLPVEW